MDTKFQKIMHAVTKQLEQIISEEDEDERGFITAKDFMNDFATQDFIEKNIRVQPQNEASRPDMDDGKTGDYQSRIQDAPKDEDDEQKKDVEGVRIDLEVERRKQKEQYFEFIRRKQLEEEKAKKKRQ